MTDQHDSGRRTLLRSSLGIGAGLSLPASLAVAAEPSLDGGDHPLNLSSPAEAFNAYVKLLGTLADDDVYVAFSGTLWGIEPERVPTAICGFSGLARHRWAGVEDGHERKAFDVGYFSDLETGEPIDELTNPLTGEQVAPFHYKYGGGIERYTKDGKLSVSAEGVASNLTPYDFDWKRAGQQIWLTDSGSGEFPPPLSKAEWPRESSGDAFRFMGETTMATTVEQLANANVAQADYTLFWSSVLSWEPWLLMDGRPGFAMWRGVGAKLRRYEDAPATLLAFVRGAQPNYFDDADPWPGRVSNYDRYKRQREAAS
ncbi:MAG: DUF1838 family protein [Pseudomonadota bacterium]